MSEETKETKENGEIPGIRANILLELHSERVRQDEKFGQQNHIPPYYLMILGEEVGEANKAALEAYFGHHLHGKPLDYSHYREELVQIAAVALAMIECLDRNGASNGL